jgi:polyhydroxyalkanoate synthase subunit PhaE
MDSFDYGKALSEMWTLGGKAFLDAQGQALRAMREGAAAMGLPAGMPGGMPGAGLPGMAMPGVAMPGGLPGLAPPPAFPNLAFDAGEIGKAGQALAELWTSASDLAAALAQRLPQQPAPQGADAAAGAAAAATQAGAESTVAATLRRMIDPRVWLSAGDDMEEALQRMAEGPRFADLWDNERRFAGVFGAWMALRRRSLEHQAVVLEGWTTAARRFAERLGERLGERAAQGEASSPVASQRAALDLWIETANRTLLEMQRSERYLESQAQLLKASTELRLAQQAVAEYYGRMFGLPTRTELDDVHRTVTELRRALRAVERRLRQQQQQAAAAAAAAAEKPAAAAAMRASRPAARRGKKTEEN